MSGIEFEMRDFYPNFVEGILDMINKNNQNKFFEWFITKTMLNFMKCHYNQNLLPLLFICFLWSLSSLFSFGRVFIILLDSSYSWIYWIILLQFKCLLISAFRICSCGMTVWLWKVWSAAECLLSCRMYL